LVGCGEFSGLGDAAAEAGTLDDCVTVLIAVDV